ncbi:DUF3108 domain-containing protein [Hydrogenophaga sp. RWCD_12]|uniref:DUF3108 domain-containing protein n=1 Tax=Hydrogenophaga sp. RWCD_12 TaxID=3391190 RepID=UPI003984F566
MSAASLPLSPERAAPRPRVLFGLGAGVLLAHLSLLSGGLSGLSLDMFVSTSTDASGGPSPTAAAKQDPATAAAPLPDELPAPVQISRVRWIVPKAPEPVKAPEPPPKLVKPPPEPPIVIEPPAPPPVVAEPVPPVPPPVEVAVAAPVPPVVETPPPAVQEPASDLQPGTEVAAGTVVGAGAGLSEAGLPPASPPPSVSLRYAATAIVKGATYSGSGKLDWQHDGQQYEAKLAARVLLFTVLEWTSAGRMNDKGLVPDRFSDKRRSSERAAHFDREGQRIRYSNNASDAKLLPGAQDRLSVNLQLAGLFNARPDAYAEGQMLRLPVTSVDAAEVWLFQVGPLATESLPAGEVSARKLTRSPRKEYDRKVEVWLLPGYAHLPGHIRITEPNGDSMDLKLQEFPALNLGPAQGNVP